MRGLPNVRSLDIFIGGEMAERARMRLWRAKRVHMPLRDHLQVERFAKARTLFASRRLDWPGGG